MKNYKRIIATAMAIFMLSTVSCVTLSGCGCSGNGAVIETSAPLTEEKIKMTIVKTPYGNLEFEDEDKNDIIVEQNDEKDYYIVKFKAEVGKKKVTLFDVRFGDGSGDYLGTVKKDDEAVSVWLNFYDIEPDGFSEEQLNKIYGLQENINPVKESIESNSSFKE